MSREVDMNTVIHAIEVLAIVMTMAMPFIIYRIWRTTDNILFVLLASLYTFVCGFVSVVAIYGFVTYL
jgi:hypothetical protein